FLFSQERERKLKNGDNTNSVLVPGCAGIIWRNRRSCQQKSYLQRTLPYHCIFCNIRSLYFDECTVSCYCKYYRLCRRYYGLVSFCNNADEPEHRNGTCKKYLHENGGHCFRSHFYDCFGSGFVSF